MTSPLPLGSGQDALRWPVGLAVFVASLRLGKQGSDRCGQNRVVKRPPHP
jgi:hypothetical protein